VGSDGSADSNIQKNVFLWLLLIGMNFANCIHKQNGYKTPKGIESAWRIEIQQPISGRTLITRADKESQGKKRQK
jgi:hypothetical protein